MIPLFDDPCWMLQIYILKVSGLHSLVFYVYVTNFSRRFIEKAFLWYEEITFSVQYKVNASNTLTGQYCYSILFFSIENWDAVYHYAPRNHVIVSTVPLKSVNIYLLVSIVNITFSSKLNW